MKLIKSERKRVLLRYLQKHCVGKSQAQTAETLFRYAFGEYVIPARVYDQTRFLRDVVTELRVMDGVAVCGDNAGYYIAECDDEIDKTVSRLMKRARTSFVVARAMSKISVVDLLRQFDLIDDDDLAEIRYYNQTK